MKENFARNFIIENCKKRFKDNNLNLCYWGYILVKEPEKVRCGGAFDCAFKRGYEGKSIAKFIPRRTSLTYACFVAGKEWSKKGEIRKKYWELKDKKQ